HAVNSVSGAIFTAELLGSRAPCESPCHETAQYASLLRPTTLITPQLPIHTPRPDGAWPTRHGIPHFSEPARSRGVLSAACGTLSWLSFWRFANAIQLL